MGVSIIGIFTLALIFAMLSATVVTVLRARRLQGRSLPQELIERLPFGQPALVYFHAPGCGPCRAMEKPLRKVSRLGAAVISIDASKEPKLASSLGVYATPTCLIVREQVVTEVVLGRCTARKLARRLGLEPGLLATT